MKHIITITAAAMILLAGGCSSGKSETEIIWLCDKAAGQSLTLFPDASPELVTSLGLKEAVPSSISAFLVRKDGKVLLFDTGLGLPDGGIRRGLDSLGLTPADVDYLYLTHFMVTTSAECWIQMGLRCIPMPRSTPRRPNTMLG